MSEAAAAALAVLQGRGVVAPVEFGLVLGSGLADVVDLGPEAVVAPYSDLPGFPAAGVTGHAGMLAVGHWNGARVAVFGGRVHYYESGDSAAMRVPLETLKALGAGTVILTNSAGSLDPASPPGTIVPIGDHINFSGRNPLIGMPGDARFVNMTAAYDPALRARLRRAAAAAGVPLARDGVYMWFSGPSFETPAEVRMARMLGADLVGMSTVPEVILARHLALKVAALSVVTNFGTGIGDGDPSHAETKVMALASGKTLQALLAAFLREGDATHG